MPLPSTTSAASRQIRPTAAAAPQLALCPRMRPAARTIPATPLRHDPPWPGGHHRHHHRRTSPSPHNFPHLSPPQPQHPPATCPLLGDHQRRPRGARRHSPVPILPLRPPPTPTRPTQVLPPSASHVPHPCPPPCPPRCQHLLFKMHHQRGHN